MLRSRCATAACASIGLRWHIKSSARAGGRRANPADDWIHRYGKNWLSEGVDALGEV